MKKLLKYIWRLIVNFFIFLWHLILSFETWKGITALVMAFMLVEGWALAFIVLGWFADNIRLLSIGSAWTVFWLAPMTPMWVFTAFIAYLLQRYILRDKNVLKWTDIKTKLKRNEE